MKDNIKSIITIVIFLVIFLVIILITPNNNESNLDIVDNVIEGFTDCTQVTGDCNDCVNSYIDRAGYICMWDPSTGCNSFDGSRDCSDSKSKDSKSKTSTTINVNDREIISTTSEKPNNQLNKPIIQINYNSKSTNINENENINENINAVRAGGIVSTDVTNQMNYSKGPGDTSVYNYGVPGTETPTDSIGQIDQYAVEYKERPSVTGMFTETGPMGANIGAFDDLHDCNCVIVNE